MTPNDNKPEDVSERAWAFACDWMDHPDTTSPDDYEHDHQKWLCVSRNEARDTLARAFDSATADLRERYTALDKAVCADSMYGETEDAPIYAVQDEGSVILASYTPTLHIENGDENDGE